MSRWFSGLWILCSKSYVWSSLGVTSLAFLTGALAFWLPTFLTRAHITQGLRPSCTGDTCNTTDRCSVTFDLRLSQSFSIWADQKLCCCCCLMLHSFIFGAVTVATGVLGGALGTTISRRLVSRFPHADPLICAVGMLGSVPCLFVIIFVASSSIPATYVREQTLCEPFLFHFLFVLFGCLEQ